MQPLFALDDFSIESQDGPILRIPRLTLRDCATTAFLGPVGTGKSLLLRALAGVRPAGTIHYGGTLRHRGEVYAADRDFPRDGVAWIGQSKAGADLAVDDVVRRTEGIRVLLLDEIERRVPEVARPELVQALRAARENVGVVIVTHDMTFARNVADDVHLVCAGSVVASAEASRFFEVPPGDLAAKFVREGNCWPASEPQTLPSSFRWILDGQLAGTARPGLLRDLDEDLGSMAMAGITELVTLTEEPPPLERLRSFGLASHHFPVPDMGVPAVGRAVALCHQIDRSIAAGGRVAVHCAAGLGRTGTILAAVLVVRDGIDADLAIRRIRAVEPRMIQNRAQEHFVERVAEAMGH